MFPLRDENPTVHRTYVTYILIGINLLVWAFIQGLGTNPSMVESVCRFGMIPAEIIGRIDPGTRIRMGTGFSCMLDGIPDYHTVITSMFLHGSWFHLIGNMWFLIVFGDNVEDAMGPVRFLLFYLVCGVFAASAQMLLNPGSTIPMVGASGAISGIMGAYAILFPLAPVHLLVFIGFFITTIRIPAFFMLVYWLFIQLIGGMIAGQSGGVAFWAHAGGFIAGIVLLRYFCNPKRLDVCKKARKRIYRGAKN